MSYSASDLGISQAEIDQITSNLANANKPDPIADAIAGATQTVTDYTKRYVLTSDRILGLLKPLVMFELHSQINGASDSQVKAKDDAMRELREIRDGAFPDLPLANPAPQNTGGTGAWGSSKQIRTR